MNKNTKFEEREKSYKEALRTLRVLARENPDIYAPHIAQILGSIGNFYWKAQKYFQAEVMYTEALEMQKELAEHNPVYNLDVATILNNIGNLYSNTQRFGEAEKAYTEALKIRRTLARENPVYSSHVVTTLNNLGILYNTTQRFSEAEKAFTEALDILEHLTEQDPDSHVLDMAMILLNTAALFYDEQRFSEAEKMYKKALKIYRNRARENPDVYSDVALVLNNLGSLYLYTQQYSEAEIMYDEALKIRRTLAEENPDLHTPHVAMILKNLGVLRTCTQQYSEAEIMYDEALKIRRTLAEENPAVFIPDVAAILNNLGNLYKDMQKFSEAENAFTEALEKYTALAEKNPAVYTPDVAATLDSIGSFYTYTHKFSEAEKVYNKALKMRKELAKENPAVFLPEVALTLNNLGNLFTCTHKYSEAEKAYNEALEMRRKLAKQNPHVHSPHAAMILNNLGNVYSDTKNYSEAEKVYNEALKMRRELEEKDYEAHIPDVARVLNNLGNLYKDMQKYPEAEKAYNEALKIKRTFEKENKDVFAPEIASTLNNLGNLYKDLKEYSEAERAYVESIQKYRERALWFETAQSLYNLSTITFDEKTLEDSRKLLELAILLSREEKYKYIQKGRYENIYHTLLARDMTTFSIFEALRDPQLLSLSWDEPIFQRNLERAHNDLEFQESLVEKTMKERISNVEFDLNVIPEDVLFMYIQEMANYLIIGVVEKGGVNRYTCKKEFLSVGNRLLYNLRLQQKAAKKRKDLTFVTEKFDELAEHWIRVIPEEIETLIKEKDCIVFSPDVGCSFLPLEALSIDGNPLCIEKTVVRATSLHQVLHLERIPKFNSSLIVGNPWPLSDKKKLIYSLPNQPECFKIPFLQKAQEEAEALTNKLPHSTVLLGQDASGERFLSEISRHSLIHFTGHGDLGRILLLSGPLNGFPPLFEPEEFSDYRRAERIQGIRKINMMEEWHPVTDLDLFDVHLKEGVIIFLNACETGKHKYAGGGYYQGLPAVFLKNGAHSVVSSLIPLFENHSKEFALHFYDNLLYTHSVSESLKRTRIWAQTKYKAPIHWVPYIHYGPPL